MMALDLIFPLSDGGRRSGLDLKKTRTDQTKTHFKKMLSWKHLGNSPFRSFYALSVYVVS